MQIALVTMIDDNFVIGFEAFIKSMKINNPWFMNGEYIFHIIDVGLSYDSKAIIETYADKFNFPVIFTKPDKKDYSVIDMSKTAGKLKNTYYTFDVFKLPYDRVVFIDMDTIVMGDIQELFSCSEDIAAVKGYNARQDIIREDINSGVFVVNSKYLNAETYQALINFSRRGFSMPDQKAINGYFKGQIKYFNKKYNVEKRMLNTKNYQKVMNDIRILHFVARKPWESKEGYKPEELVYDELEQIWHKYYDIEV